MTGDLFEVQHPSIGRLDKLIASRFRSREFIADFSSGYAAGWGFAVSRMFVVALDIRLTTRVKRTKEQDGTITRSEILEMTQGHLFSFREKDTFYDTPGAYSPTWKESLQKLKYRIDVLSADSATRNSAGSVKIELHEKCDEILRKVPLEKSELTQFEFVRCLIFGPEHLRKSCGKVRIG